MSSLRSDLQSEDPLQQAAALLQLLNSLAGGRDVGTAVTITCQTVMKGAGPPAVKRLGYDVVKAAALTDADWENVLMGFLNDISPTYPSIEVQTAAIEVLPLIPPHKLRALLTQDGKLAGLVTRQLATSTKEVRASALTAAGRWLSDTVRSAVLAASPDIAALAKKWVQSVAEALGDPNQAVAGAAFDAARCDALSESAGVPATEILTLAVAQAAAEPHRGRAPRAWRVSTTDAGDASSAQHASGVADLVAAWPRFGISRAGWGPASALDVTRFQAPTQIATG